MNTRTQDYKVALKKAKEIAKLRGMAVWLHFGTTLTYWIDYIPVWWNEKDLANRKADNEIVEPE